METLTTSKQDLNLLILKSDICTKKDVAIVNQVFSKINAIRRWSIDLEDWEHVLKVEAFILSATNIAVILEQFGYQCAELNH